MSEHKRPGPYPAEVRERAVRLVFDHQHEYPSQWKAIESISETLGVNHETLRNWVRRAETDAGKRPGLTTDEREKTVLSRHSTGCSGIAGLHSASAR
jgi:transposase-like protein